MGDELMGDQTGYYVDSTPLTIETYQTANPITSSDTAHEKLSVPPVENFYYQFTSNRNTDRCICILIYLWIAVFGMAALATYQYLQCQECQSWFIGMWVLWGFVMMPIFLFVLNGLLTICRVVLK